MSEASVVQVEPGVFSVLWEGRSYTARLSGAAGSYVVELAGHRIPVEIRDPRNAVGRSQTAAATGRQNITAAMPGKVVRLLVEEGQEVQVGQGLIVVEAMKMQNEMKAAKAGKVAKVHTQAGATVAAGDVLLVIE